MLDLFPEIDIDPAQAEAIARGLITVAKADGQVHEREGAMISEFFASVTGSAADLGALQKADPAGGEYLAASLPTPEHRKLFIMTTMLLAFADGNFSAAESKLIGDYAAALGVSDDELDKMEQQVKEFMLSQLTGVKNTDAVAAVAKELKVS